MLREASLSRPGGAQMQKYGRQMKHIAEHVDKYGQLVRMC